MRAGQRATNMSNLDGKSSERVQGVLTSIVPDGFKVDTARRVVQDGTGDRRPSERAERHDRERHPCASPDIPGSTHVDCRVAAEGNESSGGDSACSLDR